MIHQLAHTGNLRGSNLSSAYAAYRASFTPSRDHRDRRDYRDHRDVTSGHPVDLCRSSQRGQDLIVYAARVPWLCVQSRRRPNHQPRRPPDDQITSHAHLPLSGERQTQPPLTLRPLCRTQPSARVPLTTTHGLTGIQLAFPLILEDARSANLSRIC